MGSDVYVGVVGATGAVGREVVEVIGRTRWAPDRLALAASPTTSVTHLEYADGNLPIEDASLLDTGMLDAVVLAAPAEASLAVGERAIEDGVPVIDVSGAFGQDADVPVVVPWINPHALAELGMRNVVSLPGAPANLLASVLGPLGRAGILGEAHATVMVPASAWGRAGMDELSKQVVSLFNAGTPPRKVFPHGLAFDVLPSVGELDEEGWTDAEHLAVRQVHALLGAELPLSVTLVAVPVFSGVSMDLTLRPTRRALPELALRILDDAGVGIPEKPGARHIPRPRRVEGQPFAQVGRVRTSSEGSVLHLWASMDNVRATATAAVGLVGAVLRDRIGSPS